MASTIITYCQDCGLQKENNLNYCPSCGKEVSIDDEQSLIEYYFYRGYTYQSIVKLLDKQHDIQISEQTLKYCLQNCSLRRRLPTYDLAQIRLRVAEELDGPDCMSGYRAIWHTLHLDGLQIPHRVVAGVVTELDPEGCEMRRSKRLRRRKYSVPGPNHC